VFGIRKVFLAALAGILVVAGFTGLLVQKEPYVCEDCNVLLIIVDTLRADHVSSYGYFKETTPVIDRLASEGILFENAFSQIPTTPPSIWSMMSGVYPHRHGMFLPDYPDEDIMSLGTILGENGYETAGFVSSYMVRGLIYEFDEFWLPRGRVETPDDEDAHETKRPVPANVTTGRVLEWLDENGEERFFLMVHYFDPHNPYEPPEGFDVFDYTDEPRYSDGRYSGLGIMRKTTIREDIAKYDGEIRFADYNIGTVLDKLDELNIDGKTLVVLVADHGECFGEHNFSDFGYDIESPCVFHGKTLYDQEIHIPMVIRNPNSTIRGRITNLVESIDLMPTILDIIGIDVPEVDGRSLAGLIEGEPSSEPVVFQTKPFMSGLFSVGIRTEGWKYVKMTPSELRLEDEVAEQSGEGTEEEEEASGIVNNLLFNLVSDPGENENVFDRNAVLAEGLIGVLADTLKGDNREIVIDRETEEILRSLGYIE
jgi:arylsulfatase A-like enzyme